MDFLRILRSATPETLLGGRYKIIGQLGAGGFGQTFLAEDLHLPGNARCVVKQLKPQFTDAFNLKTAKRLFDTEAQVLYQLGNHDQIPRLLAHFEHKQEFYLAQELIVGEPLTGELGEGHPWSESQVVALVQDLLGVLTFVHQQNVIHRDIKPANLIRRRHDGRIVLIDFGAVKQAATQLANPNSGPTFTIAIGTQGYMPNEQIGGNPRFSSDIYAVGMVGIQAATGRSPKSLEEDIKTGEMQWRHLAPHLSPALSDVLDQMVRYDFRARYPTAVEAFAAISNLAIAPVAPASQVPSPPLSAPDAASHLPASHPSLQTEPLSPALQLPSTLPQPMRAIPPSGGSGNSNTPTEPLIPQPPIGSPSAVPSTLLSPEAQRRQFKSRIKARTLLVPLVGVVAIASGIGLLRPLLPTASVLQSPSISSATNPVPPSPPPPDPATQATALIAQAHQQREQGQFQQALALYDQVITLDTASSAAHWGRCYSLNQLKKLTEAIAACDTALTLKPDYPEALWSKGYALDQQQKHQEALKLYDRSIALRPDFAEAWSNKGTTLLLLNRPNDAVKALDQATRLDPTLAEAWNNRGAALWSLRRFRDAIASVDRALQLQPDYPDALTLRQQMRNRLGQ